MPKFKAVSNVKRFLLPSTKELPEAEQAWVDLEVGKLVAGDLVGLDEVTTDIERSAKLLLNRIKAWNFTDDTDAPVPVTYQSILRLDVNDFAYLSSQFGLEGEPLTTEQKKS